MADYGFDPSLPPDIDAEAQALKRRQMVANMLFSQAMKPAQGQMVGRFYVPASPLQGIANLASAYASRSMMDEGDKERAALGEKYRKGVTDALTQYQQTKAGTPEQTIQFDTPRPDGTGDMTQTVPAVKADPRAAVMNALTSPYPQLQKIGALDYAQMAKPPEKYDAGDKWVLMKDGQVVGYLPKAASPDAVLKEEGTQRRFEGVSGDVRLKESGLNQRFLGVSGNTAATINAANQRHDTASGDARLREEGAQKRFEGVSGNTAAQIDAANTRHETPSADAVLSSTTTRRGQDLSAETSRRGQDMSAETARRGQDLTDQRQREENAVAAKTAQLRQRQLETQLKQQGVANAGAVASYQTALETLGRLEKHPGMPEAVGASVSKTLMPFIGPLPGTKRADFIADLDAFKSQTFLPMVQNLRGMGALSDAEGKKLTAAVGALDPSMSEAAFKEHIGIIRKALEDARDRVKSLSQPQPAAVTQTTETPSVDDLLRKYGGQ